MPDNKIIVKKNSRVTIEIGGGGKVQSPKPKVQSAKGLIRSRRADDYLPRRLAKGLRFFDLGRAANGDDLDFLYSPSFTFTDWGLGIPIPQADLTAYSARDSFLLALTESNNFDSVFYEIKKTDGDFYYLTLLIDGETEEILTTDSTLWNANGIGIKPPGEIDYIAISFNPGQSNEWRSSLWNYIEFGTSYIKVTTANDFDADAVSGFRLNANDKVFLIPALPTHRVYTNFYTSVQEERILGNDFRFGLRKYYLTNQNPDIDPTIQGAGFPGYPPEYYENGFAAAQIHAGFSTPRIFRRYYDDIAMQTVWETVSDPFDITPDPPFTPTVAPGTAHTIESSITTFGAVGGALLAIVKRGSSLFYIWQS